MLLIDSMVEDNNKMAFPLFQNRPSAPESFPFNDIIGKILQGYKDTSNARYQQPSLHEALIKAQQENKWYGPNMESQIGLRGAQVGHLGAQNNLLGEQTRGAKIENQYLPEKLRAQVAQSAIQQQLIQQIMNGNRQQPQQDMQNYKEDNGTEMFAKQQNVQSNQISPQQNQQPSNGLTYPQAAIAMHMLGLGKPQIENINGKYTAFTPFGNTVVGEGQSKLQEALSKEDAKKISGLEDTVLKSGPKMDTLRQIEQIVSSPLMEQMRSNPILGRHELGWFSKLGTKEQQEAVGNFRAFTGQIIKDSARDFAGQFRVGEQGLLNSMKPNDSDSLAVMKGKTESLSLMVQMLAERSRIEADLMRNRNMSALQASLAADKMIDTKKMKQDIHIRLHPPTKKSLEQEIRRRNLRIE